jgi:beta-lactamase regulating signal transducer with metallopeptidase domain
MITAIFDWGALSANSNTWLEALLSVSAKGLLIVMIAAGLSFALRKASAASRHLVWSLALLSLLALPVLTFGLPSWRVPILPLAISAEQTDGANLLPATSAQQSHESEPIAAARHLPQATKRATSASSFSWPVMTTGYSGLASEAKSESLGWAAWALILWLSGALLIFARLLIAIASVRRMALRAERINDDEWSGLAERLAFRVGLARQVALHKSHSLTMPLTFGLMRSSILLPADADDWSDERREVVLMHELAHVKRRDCLTQMLAQVACAIYWFNPLIWAAARQLRVERERACDDQVLDAGAKATDYADHLLDIARQLRSAKCSSPAAVAIARRSQLEGRLLAILDPSVRRRGLSRAAAIAVGLAVACIVLPLASLRPSAHAQAKPSERAEVMAPVAAESLNGTHSAGPIEKIAPPQTPPQPQVSNITPPAEPQLSETEAAAPEPSSVEQEPKAQPAPTPANQQEKDSAVDALTEALKDEDAEMREQALFALSQIRGPRATQALLGALKDSNPEVREKAIWALGMRHGDALTEPLINALRDSNSDVREKAAWALGMNGDNRAVEPLANALRDENADVRQYAAWALGMRGDSRAVEPLINALKDSAPDVRGMAAWALGMKGDKRAMKALSAAMRDQNKDVRQKAAWALGMLLMRNGESITGDNDLDIDTDVDLDNDGGTGSGAGHGEGSGTSSGVGTGKGRGSGKAKAKP